MDTIRARNARKQQMTTRQQEIIIGTLLGDGYLDRTTRGYALRINHGIEQRAYVDWKYREIESFTNSPPREYKNSYYFRTVSHAYFDELRRQFYSGKRKIPPKQIIDWMTPLVFSVWLMDDGSRDWGQVRLNSQSFSKKENEELIRILEVKLGIIASLNLDKGKYRLRVRAKSMPRVLQLATPHIIPSMRYKLSL
jgi:hypothetical protein